MEFVYPSLVLAHSEMLNYCRTERTRNERWILFLF